MIAGMMVLEDMVLHFHRADNASAWLVRICDSLTGKQEELTLTDPQMAAMTALAVDGSDGFSEALNAELYALAEPAVKDLPAELRPIP